MAEDAQNNTLMRLAVAVVAPLIVSSAVAVTAILWRIEPTVARQQQAIETVKEQAAETRQEVKLSANRQIEIRLQLSEMNAKLDTLLEQKRKDDGR